jgi:PPM family protein phosphatase
MVRFDAYTASNSISAGHRENQDTYLADMSTLLFAVADGVGGYEGGKEASELAVAALRNRAVEIQNEFAAKSVLEDVHEQLLHTAKSRNYRNMGTTIALTKILPDYQSGPGGKAIIANVGDSPILYFPKSIGGFETEYEKVSTDDSFRDKAPGSMWAIVQYLEVHTKTLSFRNGDVLLLCSDGITDNLLSGGSYSRKGVGDIREIIRTTGSAGEIVDEAMRAGVKADDMTAVLVFL